MDRFTRIERYHIYKKFQADLNSAKEVTFDCNDVYWDFNGNQINFCRLLHNVIIRHQLVFIDDLPELMSAKPKQCYINHEDYWFHPYDIASRKNLINQILDNFHISITDRIVNILTQIYSVIVY